MLNLLSTVKKLPDTPGVYFFRDAKGKVLYVGKATSLRSRVQSYFSGRVLESRGPLIAELTERVKKITFEKTDSVLEALILEAYLIKKHQPSYNTDEKDDRSFNYVVVTKEKFPRVLVVRGKDLAEQFPKKEIRYQFGPFPQGFALREAMKLVRKIFPFRDTCAPCALFSNSRELENREKRKKQLSRNLTCKSCFSAQIGLCPGVCTGTISKEEYGKTILNIKLFFEGKKKALLRQLARDMKRYAKQQEFEKAAATRKTIFALNHIQDVALMKRELKVPASNLSVFRIEAYDIAHLSGTSTVGVFTVVEDGRPKKADYRMFRIRRSAAGSDTGALCEVLERRLRHDEWPMPKLLVVDGAAAQKNAAERVLRSAGVSIPVVAVVKDERHHPREILGEGSAKHTHEREILLANSEAHRFALSYHRKIRQKKIKHTKGK